MAAQEAVMAGDKLAIEQVNEDQEVGSKQADGIGDRGEGEEPHDLTDETDVEVEQF
jgi:hypothetical protein